MITILFLLYSCFNKDECREYSDFTCKEIEQAKYNVYFRFPDNEKDYHLGEVEGLNNCQSVAHDYARRKDLSYNDWSYICCMIAKGSSCYSAHR